MIHPAQKHILWSNCRKWLLMLIFCNAFYTFAQDTLCVYFTSGEHNLSEHSKSQVNNFVFAHDIQMIDSIVLAGYADSTGQHEKNLKLSERRAKVVSKYLSKAIPNNTIPILLVPKGEENQVLSGAALNHRRVEVILYFPKSYVPPVEKEEVNSSFVHSNCYQIADSVMAQSNFTYFQKGASKYVRVEMETFQYNPNLRLYTLSAKTKYPKLIKPELKNTGDLWWKRPRYVAEIKAKDFDKFGIVTLSVGDTSASDACIVCGDEKPVSWRLGFELMTDQFVMQNLQVRKQILPARYEVIVPQEYLSIENGYYLDSLTNFPLTWQYKRGRRAAPYYFTTIPENFLNTESFSIYSYQRYCSNSSAESAVFQLDTLKKHVCAPTSSFSFDYTYGVSIAYQQTRSDEGIYSGYLQVNMSRFEAMFSAGISSRGRTAIGLDADYHFFAFTPVKERSVGGSNQGVLEEFHRLISAYAGTSFTTLIKSGNNSFNEDFHLGISYWNKPFSSGIDRIFIQSGLGFDYLSKESKQFVSVRAGIRFKI